MRLRGRRGQDAGHRLAVADNSQLLASEDALEDGRGVLVDFTDGDGLGPGHGLGHTIALSALLTVLCG